MATILFAEDEAILGKLVKEALEREPDFDVQWVTNGNDALHAFRRKAPDICILDVMMPGMDGFTLARNARALEPGIPILFLTARSQTADVVKGFEAGGNDYLKKPFSLEELVLRVRELLKRMGNTNDLAAIEDVDYTMGIYCFNPSTQILSCPQADYQLSGKETALMKELVLHKNRLLERNAALLKLLGDNSFFNARNMDVYIARLRKYLMHDPSLSIINIRGYGFKLIEK